MTTLTLRPDRNGEPRISDETLAVVLDCPSARPIRKLALRHRDELSACGVLSHFDAKLGANGRPRRTYLFNERQALLVCMFARTAKAAEARRAVIDTFAAWRNGTLQPYKPIAKPVTAHRAVLVDSFHLRMRHDGVFCGTFQTRNFDVAKAMMEACLAPLLA